MASRAGNSPQYRAFAGSRKKRHTSTAAGPRLLAEPGWRGRIPVAAAVAGTLLLPSVLPAQENAPKHLKSAAVRKPTVETIADRQVRNAIEAGDGDLVLRTLRQQVLAEPANLDTRLALALAYEKQGAPELAVEHYRVAAEQYGSERAAARWANLLDSLGEPEQAVLVLVHFCDSQTRVSSGILSELGILLDDMGDFTKAERYHQRALAAALVEAAPGQDALHNNLGYNLILQNRHREAQDELRKALELNRRSEVARNNLAFALASAPGATPPETSEAILHWQSLAGPAAAHNNLAAVYIGENRFADARRELEQAIAFDHGHAPALKNLELVASLDGKPAEVAVVPAQVAVPLTAKRISLWRRIFHPSKPAGEHSASVSATANRKNRKPNRNTPSVALSQSPDPLRTRTPDQP